MMSFQTMNTKRCRDDDSDSDDDRYIKKSRTWNIQQYHGSSKYQPPSLPLRASPSPPCAVPGLEIMTPAHSDDGEANSPASIHDEPPSFSSPRNDMDYAMQMDEDDFDVVSSQPPDSPFITTNFRPAKLNPDLFGRDSAVSNTDRMPTPMYPTFHTGGMSGLGFPSSGMAGGMGMGFSTHSPFSKPLPHSAPRMLPPPRKQSNTILEEDVDRSRRMPSPISEDEDIPDTPTALTQSQLSRLSVTGHFNNPADQMDAEMGPPPLMLPTPRGRKRSGALTGMGRFSMGYRDDCEKCRMRVPGHYSHFLQQ